MGGVRSGRPTNAGARRTKPIIGAGTCHWSSHDRYRRSCPHDGFRALGIRVLAWTFSRYTHPTCLTGFRRPLPACRPGRRRVCRPGGPAAIGPPACPGRRHPRPASSGLAPIAPRCHRP
ncbi:hypothetical protein G6F24_018196 [Rhizopus arrhizus]|nr:hypothetical protein G6F24_018196 [Rhizopus arrhizus]